jgi:sugar phosphate isomerase/epimerase
MKQGLQVYSVRNQLTGNFEATMEYVAKVGYKYIEGYGLGLDGLFLNNISASHLRKLYKIWEWS